MADGSLIFDTQLDSTGLKTGLSGIGGVAKAGLGVAAAGFAAVTTAAIGTTKAITDSIKETAAYGDEIDKMSQKMGITSEAYQEWDFIMQHCGTSMDQLKPAMKTLANAADSNNAAFARLGITEEELATLNQEDLFSHTITKLQEMEEGTERTAIASDLLGRGAAELGALLNMSAKDTEAMRLQVHELGGVMSSDAVKAAAAFQDSMQNLQTAAAGLKRGFAEDLLPSVTDVIDGFTMLISGDKQAGLDAIRNGVQALASSLMDALPTILEAGGSIILTIAQAIIDNLPTLIDAGMNILNGLIGGILANIDKILDAAIQLIGALCACVIENLPMIVQAALQIVLALAMGIAQALPELIPALVETVVQIVNGLIENIPLLIECAIQLIMGLARGLIQAIPVIIEALPTLITSIINALIDAIPLIIECGIELFIALIEALPQIIIAIVEAAPKIVEALVDGFARLGPKLKDVGINLITKVKDGILSLLTNLGNVAKDIGKNIIDGIWNGISGAWTWLTDKVGSLASGLFDKAKKALGISSPSKKFKYIGEMCVAGFDEGIEDLMSGEALGAAVNSSLGVVSANTQGLNAGPAQTFNFYDTQTSPDAIRRKVESTMTFGLAGGI